MGEVKQNYYINLPCKPVVKQYLVNRYGERSNMPEGEWVKLLLINLLQRSTGEDDKDITLQYYTAMAVIPITYDQFQRYGDTLSKTAIREINNRVEDVIRQQLFQFLEFFVHVANYQLKDAIYMFQEVYALPEDVYAAETIKKYYQRKIQPFVNARSFIAVNVPFKKKRKYNRAA